MIGRKSLQSQSADHTAALRVAMGPLNRMVATCPMLTCVPVQWGEMDSFGHVNNAVFLKCGI